MVSYAARKTCFKTFRPQQRWWRFKSSYREWNTRCVELCSRVLKSLELCSLLGTQEGNQEQRSKKKKKVIIEKACRIRKYLCVQFLFDFFFLQRKFHVLQAGEYGFLLHYTTLVQFQISALFKLSVLVKMCLTRSSEFF